MPIGTQTLTDDFNRANETPLAGNWTNVTADSGRINLATNAVTPSVTNSDCSAYYTNWTGGNDQYSQIEITETGTGPGSGMGPAVRHTTSASTKTYYRLVMDAGGSYELDRMNAGTPTSLRTGAVGAFLQGKKLGLNVKGQGTATLQIWYNNAQQGTDVTDSSPLASGNPGIAYSSTLTTATGDNWDAGIPATAGGPLKLKPYAFKPAFVAKR